MRDRADHTADERVVITQGQLDQLVARIARLEAGLAPARPVRSGATPADPPDPPEPSSARIGRRRALAGLAGAAAAGTAVALGAPTPVAADDGDPLILGQANSAPSPTTLTLTGGPTTSGLAVVDGTPVADLPSGQTILGHAKGDAAYTAVQGFGEGPATVAIDGRSDGGVAGSFSTSAADVPALTAAGMGIGVSAAGARGQVALTPESASPLTFPTPGQTGTLYVQAGQTEESFVDGTLWACVDDGTPGTWRKLAGHDTAGALHLLPTPRRVYDSRPGTTPSQGPKTPLPAGNIARTIDLKHNASGVPAGATGAILTVLLVGAATGAGNLTVWANGQPKPASNTMVWGGSAGRFTTLALTAVDGQARIRIDASLQTHVALDVVAYFR